MIAEKEILRMSPDPFPRSGWGLGPRLGYTIRGKCHMIAEKEILRMSPDPFPRSGWGLGPRRVSLSCDLQRAREHTSAQ